MTLGEHIDELRRRLLRGLLTVVVLFIVAFGFVDTLAHALWAPHRTAVEMINADRLDAAIELVRSDPEIDGAEYFVDPEASDEDKRLLAEREVPLQLIQTAPGESFLFALKTAFYLALFVGSPILLWELWGFIAAGLYSHERGVVTRHFPVSVLLFVVGVLFSYFVMLPYAMYFLGAVFDLEWVQPQYKVSEYASILFTLSLALGTVFQLPIVMIVLARLGVVQPATYSRYRPYFLVGAFAMAAILTPPDPFTQILMAGPMVVLYEIGILVARLVARPRQHPGGEGSGAEA